MTAPLQSRRVRMPVDSGAEVAFTGNLKENAMAVLVGLLLTLPSGLFVIPNSVEAILHPEAICNSILLSPNVCLDFPPDCDPSCKMREEATES